MFTKKKPPEWIKRLEIERTLPCPTQLQLVIALTSNSLNNLTAQNQIL